MIRLCPNCQSERPLHEMFCAGDIGGRPCGWDLSSLQERAEGWRPADVVASLVLPDEAARCVNGHPVDEGDLICTACGVDLSAGTASSPDCVDMTVIDGWQLGKRLPGHSRVRERFLAVHETDGRQGVLTLYALGNEPDPAVYDVLRQLPRDHVPAILATGRWNDRPYEVTEELTGGTLADLGLLPDDAETFRRIVDEIGRALHNFSEHGLRHRDLRPSAILVRAREPLDVVVTGFGSARLSDFDLDIVSPLETNRYTAPEALLGGVAAASDWWSLGMILLEQITRGACFEGVNDQAFLIHVLTNGAPIPGDIDPRLDLLLRGLLARDRRERWSWTEAKRWLAGEVLPAPVSSGGVVDGTQGVSIELAGVQYVSPTRFALAAADVSRWDEAKDKLLRGVVASWAEEAGLAPTVVASLRQLRQIEALPDDFRLALALKTLNPAMPLACRGEIVTPGWLLDHPEEGHELITGPVPEILARMETEGWISRLSNRARSVRDRARALDIALTEDQFQVNTLSTSRSRLAARWEDRRRVVPDTEHPSLLALLERRQTTEDDLILLLSAELGQFRTAELVVDEAEEAARAAGLAGIDRSRASETLLLPRREIYEQVEQRIAGFARCGVPRIDEWVDQFRLERRMRISRALVVLSVDETSWHEPPRQTYVSTILDFFGRRVASAIQRGPLSRMTISRSSARIDVTELGTGRKSAVALLDHILARGDLATEVDPAAFDLESTQVGDRKSVEARIRALHGHATLYRRDTGVNGLFLGFPFLLIQEAHRAARPRIMPVLLWPVVLRPELGARGRVTLGFDREREEVRLNPALEIVLGPQAIAKWKEVAVELLGRAAVRASDVADAFGTLVHDVGRDLVPLPGKDVRIRPGEDRICCSAVLFHLAYVGQAVVEDLRQLKQIPPAGTGLETMLRVSAPPPRSDPPWVPELDRYFTAASDPSQEKAVFEARPAPGLVVQGPPGTGKSQTIVNMVADAIGRNKTLLLVCQKQAALDVVHKRLVAEGLQDRVIMVTDVNRDRESTVKAIREQLEAIFGQARGIQPRPWRLHRESAAARVESIETTLNQHHEALHAADEATGLSYRDLLGELIALEEAEVRPVDAPELRQHLGSLDVARVVELEETCGPLARHWLPSAFEDSPLSDVSAFGSEAATIESFSADFSEFRDAETRRQSVLERTPKAVRLDEPLPIRAWLHAHAPSFAALTADERMRLKRWLPLFQGAGGSEGRAALSGLRTIIEGLESLGDIRPNESCRLVVIGLDHAALTEWHRIADEIARPVSLFKRLAPSRWLKQYRLRGFFREQGLGDVSTGLADFVTASDHEIRLRPWRHRLAAATLAIGADHAQLEPLPRTELIDVAAALAGQLAGAQDLANRLGECPIEPLAVAAVDVATGAAFADFVASAEQGCERLEAQADSLEKLERLDRWMSADWLEARRAHIVAEASNSENLARIAAAVPSLAAYQRFRPRAAQLDPLAIAVFRVMRRVEKELGALPESELGDVVSRTIAREARLAWKLRLENERPVLLLEAAELKAKSGALAAADREMRKANSSLLAHEIDVERLASAREWEDITRLRGHRSRRLREFLDLGRDLGLMTLRPVWLMNPDVVSRVLPLKPGLFDVVIFDEASQIPVEYSLPSLFRAATVVVSGDEKQMPPTSFFSSRIENDEADIVDDDESEDAVTDAIRDELAEAWDRREIKDCPDLLQLAKTILPTTTLEIHYRSVYRELISFSNASFYANRLSVPARHPDAEVRRVRPIEVIRVDGVYADQTNESEARRVVDLLAELWSGPVESRGSIGVVTFNRKQADRIEALLETRSEHDVVFRACLAGERERVQNDEDMSFFVKNVENVQGDERDIIVFSSTFGRNAQGTFRRNFGVLGQAGGERRLNVAVTRARQRVYLVTSMPVGEVSDMLTTRRRAESPRDFLQAYLEYARALSAGELDLGRTLLGRLSGDRRHGSTTGEAELDGVLSAVKAFIVSLGWEPVVARDAGAFGLDFAIEDPRTGLFGVGIECDAPVHGLLTRARAREIWRPSLLGRSIPQLHRVSSHGWYHEREEEKRRLRHAIERALS